MLTWIGKSFAMDEKNIRWVQRFSNYKKGLEKLRDALSEYKKRKMSTLEKEGLVQRFEYSFELAWKTLQDLLIHQGYQDIKGPLPVLKQALLDGYITGEESWRKMKEARDLTSHTYEEETANRIVEQINMQYYDLLFQLKVRLDKELEK